MKKVKFTLADLLLLLTALIYGSICFFGTNFYTFGNTSQSISVAAIVFVTLFGTAYGAILLKRTNHNFKTCFVFEIILMVLFTVLMGHFSYFTFPHYFVVSNRKAEIIEKLDASIIQAENIFSEYELYAENRINIYNSTLHRVVVTKNTNPRKYTEYGFENNGIADSIQIDNKINTLRDDLFQTNYQIKKKACITWIANSRKKLKSWTWIGIVGVANKVEQKSNNWLNELKELSSIREKCEDTDNFSCSLSFEEVQKHFTSLGKPTVNAIIWAVVAYLVMLFSILITVRSAKSPIGRNR
jgi:hypothetical protein